MSRSFLENLAGPRPNALSRWLNHHPGEPRIAWHPCADMDYKDILYLSNQFRLGYRDLQEEPSSPDIYLHSGFVDANAFDPECVVLHESWGTRIVVLQRLVLPNIGSAGDQAGPYSGQAVFLQLRVESCTLGNWEVPLICAAVDHGAMAQRMVRHAQRRAKVSHCVLLMPKRRRLTEQNFPQRLVLRIADKIGLEILVTDRLQQDPLPTHHHDPSIPDLTTWTTVRRRGTMAWSGNDSAQFLMRPRIELISMNEHLPLCPQCQLGKAIVERHLSAVAEGEGLPQCNENVIVDHRHGHRICVRTIKGWSFQYHVGQQAVRVDRFSGNGQAGLGRYEAFHSCHGDTNHQFGRGLSGNRARSIQAIIPIADDTHAAIAEKAISIMVDLYALGKEKKVGRTNIQTDRQLILLQHNNSKPNMTIRPVNREEDLPAIRQLAQRFDTFGPYAQVFENLLLGRHVHGVNVDNLEMHVADEAQEGAVGFVAVEWQRDGSDDTAEMHGVAVHSNHARQGIASDLLRYVIQRARERHVTRLQCITAATENPAALALFTHHGFQVVENVDPYPNRQTAVRLVYEIPAHPIQPEPVTAQPTEVETHQEPPVGAAQIGELGPQPPWPLPIAYEAIKGYFQSVRRCLILTGGQAWRRQQWPQGPGVYCIWRTPIDLPRQLLYIGKAGKFKRTGDEPVQLNDGCLASRLQRWTPYCFQRQGPYAEHFEYGPNGSVNEIPKMDYQSRYREHTPASEIQVECFVLSGWEHQVPPALLETLLMQDYLQSHGDLPVANNEL